MNQNATANFFQANSQHNEMPQLIKYMGILYVHYLGVKTFHFQTKLYASHKASDSYISSFLSLQDKYVETLQGIVGKSEIQTLALPAINIPNDNTILQYLKAFIDAARSMYFNEPSYKACLSPIIDDMIQETFQLIYLLSFK
jgi:hypothetical protein